MGKQGQLTDHCSTRMCS